jgi:ribonuclease HI
VTQKTHGVADLGEFRARLDDLRLELDPPTQASAYLAYTDGACLGNPDGPGGWAAIVEPSWELYGHLSSTSNNRAEALGMLAAIEWVPAGSSLVIRSDSELTVRIMQGAYKARANRDIWAEIGRAMAERQVQVTTEWVRGHAGDVGNERADRLSVWAAKHGNVAPPDGTPELRPTRQVPPELVGLKPRNDTERSFLDSVAKQLRAGRTLSDKQRAWLGDIRGRSSRPTTDD